MNGRQGNDPGRNGGPGRGDEAYLVALLQELDTADAVLDEPPTDLWAGVAATLAAEGDPVASGPAADAEHAVASLARGSGSAGVGRRRRRASSSTAWVLVPVAAAAALVVVLLGSRMLRGGGPEVVVAAEARLTSEGLPNRSDVVGRARLVDTDGREEIDLDLPALPASTTTYYEVWLLAPDGQRLQSLGVTDGHGRYAVPTTIDPHQYPIVDVSREPPDGNPAHSGDSIVRGRLDLT